MAKVASLVALIKKRLDLEAETVPGRTGEFEVIADGNTVAKRGGNWFSRKFGAGYPDLHDVVERLATLRSGDVGR